MTDLLSPGDRRTLLIGILSISLIATVGKGWPATSRWQAAELARARRALAQEAAAESGVRGVGAVRDSVVARARRLEALRATFVAGTTPTAAAAVLATLVERIAADNEVSVATVTLGTDSTVRFDLARVSVRISAESDVRGLVSFLYAVESDRAPLVVRELALTPVDPLAPASRAETLRFEAVIQSIAAISPSPARALAASRRPR